MKKLLLGLPLLTIGTTSFAKEFTCISHTGGFTKVKTVVGEFVDVGELEGRRISLIEDGSGSINLMIVNGSRSNLAVSYGGSVGFREKVGDKEIALTCME